MKEIQEFFSNAFIITSLCLFSAWIPYLFWGFSPASICFCILGNVFVILGYLLGNEKSKAMNYWLVLIFLLTVANCSFNRLEQYFNW